MHRSMKAVTALVIGGMLAILASVSTARTESAALLFTADSRQQATTGQTIRVDRPRLQMGPGGVRVEGAIGTAALSVGEGHQRPLHLRISRPGDSTDHPCGLAFG